MANVADIKATVARGVLEEQEGMMLLRQAKDRLSSAISVLQSVNTTAQDMVEAIQFMEAVKHRIDETFVLAMNAENAADRYTLGL